MTPIGELKNEETGLLPCPFCGSDGLNVETRHNQFTVICSNKLCAVHPRVKFSRKEAMELWNKRVPQTSSRESKSTDTERLGALIAGIVAARYSLEPHFTALVAKAIYLAAGLSPALTQAATVSGENKKSVVVGAQRKKQQE
jgi:Lar family restriction alleviation protein